MILLMFVISMMTSSVGPQDHGQVEEPNIGLRTEVPKTEVYAFCGALSQQEWEFVAENATQEFRGYNRNLRAQIEIHVDSSRIDSDDSEGRRTPVSLPSNRQTFAVNDDRFDSYSEYGFRATHHHWGFEVHIDTSRQGFEQFGDNIPKIAEEIRPFLTSSDGSIQLKFESGEHPRYVAKVLELFLPYQSRVDVVYMKKFRPEPIDQALAVFKVLEEFDSIGSLDMNVLGGFGLDPYLPPVLDETQLRTLDQGLAQLIRQLTKRRLFSLKLPQFTGQESLDAALDGVRISYLNLSNVETELSWAKLAFVEEMSAICLPLVDDLPAILSILARTKIHDLVVHGVTDDEIKLIAQNQNITKLTIRSAVDLSERGLEELFNLDNLKEIFLFEETYHPRDLERIEKWASSIKQHFRTKHNRDLEVKIRRPTIEIGRQTFRIEH